MKDRKTEKEVTEEKEDCDSTQTKTLVNLGLAFNMWTEIKKSIGSLPQLQVFNIAFAPSTLVLQSRIVIVSKEALYLCVCVCV